VDTLCGSAMVGMLYVIATVGLLLGARGDTGYGIDPEEDAPGSGSVVPGMLINTALDFNITPLPVTFEATKVPRALSDEQQGEDMATSQASKMPRTTSDKQQDEDTVNFKNAVGMRHPWCRSPQAVGVAWVLVNFVVVFFKLKEEERGDTYSHFLPFHIVALLHWLAMPGAMMYMGVQATCEDGASDTGYYLYGSIFAMHVLIATIPFSKGQTRVVPDTPPDGYEAMGMDDYKSKVEEKAGHKIFWVPKRFNRKRIMGSLSVVASLASMGHLDPATDSLFPGTTSACKSRIQGMWLESYRQSIGPDFLVPALDSS